MAPCLYLTMLPRMRRQPCVEPKTNRRLATGTRIWDSSRTQYKHHLGRVCEITGDRFRWCCALRHLRTQFDVKQVVLNNVQLEYLAMEVPMLKPYFYGVVACDRLPKKPAQVLLLLNC